MIQARMNKKKQMIYFAVISLMLFGSAYVAYNTFFAKDSVDIPIESVETVGVAVEETEPVILNDSSTTSTEPVKKESEENIFLNNNFWNLKNYSLTASVLDMGRDNPFSEF